MKTPGVYTLKKRLDDLHDRDQTGVLARGLSVDGPAGAEGEDSSKHDGGDHDPSAVAETGEEEGGGDFDRINAEGGPGMALTKYLPKKAGLKAKWGPFADPFGGIGRSCGLNRERP